MIAADVVEIDVNAVGRRCRQGGVEVLLGLVVDDVIDAEALEERDLLRPAR